MTRGRKPKPTAVKKLAGNPGKRALNPKEPKIPAGAPPCPRHLGKAAKAEWKRIIKELVDTGIATKVDMAALAAYCVAYGHWIEAEKMIKDPKNWTITTDKGNEIQSPWVGMANNLRNQVVKFASEFGMTPSARSRVTAIANSDMDKLEEALFGVPVNVSKGK